MSGREAEASRFASALLVPVRFLAEVVAGSGDVGEWLELLSVADVSAVAGTIALAQSLPPGYLFVVELPAGPREIRSPGTSVALKWPDGLPDYGQLEGRAAACGRTGHQGRWVRWYRFVDDQLLPEPDDDPRSTTDLLRAAASRARSGPCLAPLARDGQPPAGQVDVGEGQARDLRPAGAGVG